MQHQCITVATRKSWDLPKDDCVHVHVHVDMYTEWPAARQGGEGLSVSISMSLG